MSASRDRRGTGRAGTGGAVKAWQVTDAKDPNLWCFVMAETDGKAKTAAIEADEGETLRDIYYTEIRVRRAPELDEGIRESTLFRLGRMWTYCGHCGEIVRHHDEDVVIGEQGTVYCNNDCWSLAEETAKDGQSPTMLGFCVYADV